MSKAEQRPVYAVRAIEPGEIITDVGDRIVIGGRIRRAEVADLAVAIERNGVIAAVLCGGVLSYSHAVKGLVTEPCVDVSTAARRMRYLIDEGGSIVA